MLQLTALLDALARPLTNQATPAQTLAAAFVVAAAIAAGAMVLYSGSLLFFGAVTPVPRTARRMPLRSAAGPHGSPGSQPGRTFQIVASALLLVLTAAALQINLRGKDRLVGELLAGEIADPEAAGAGRLFPLEVWPTAAELAGASAPTAPNPQLDAPITVADLLHPALENQRAGAAEAFLTSWVAGSGIDREGLERARGRFLLAALPAVVLAAFLILRAAWVRTKSRDRPNDEETSPPAAAAGVLPLPVGVVATCLAALLLAPAITTDAALARSAMDDLARPVVETNTSPRATAIGNAMTEQSELFRNLRLLRTAPAETEAQTVWDLLRATRQSLADLETASAALKREASATSTRVAAIEPALPRLRGDLDAAIERQQRSLQQLETSVKIDLEGTQKKVNENGQQITRLGEKVSSSARGVNELESQLAAFRSKTEPRLASLQSFLAQLPAIESRLVGLEDRAGSMERTTSAGQRNHATLDEQLRAIDRRLRTLEERAAAGSAGAER